MEKLSLQDWKAFLKARLDQEQGKDEDALEVFNALLEKHPNDPHLLASRGFALVRLGREEEAAVAQAAARYSALGRTLTGDQDTPTTWTGELKSVLSDLEQFEKTGKLGATMIVW